MHENAYVNTLEAAAILRISPARVQALIAARKLGRVHKEGRFVKIPKAAVIARRDALAKIRAIQSQLDEKNVVEISS